MLFSVEQAFVGTDKMWAPLKTPAWEAKKSSAEHLDFTGSEHWASLNFSSGTVLMADDRSAQVTHLVNLAAKNGWITMNKDSLIFLYPGFSTLGEMDSVLFVGPMAPATYRFTPKKVQW